MNPGYFVSKKQLPICEQAFKAVNIAPDQLAASDEWQLAYKPRLWHGAKIISLGMLEGYYLSQIHWLIKIATFLGFALLGTLVMCFNNRLGVAYLFYTVTAFFCSSVLFFGGLAYSAPLLAVLLWLNIWVGFRLLNPGGSRRTAEIGIIVFGGTFNAFFYQLDGSLMYAFSTICFVEIFMSRDNVNYKALGNALLACMFYAVGFFGSIIFKHLVLIVMQGSFDVVRDLLQYLSLRMSSGNGAREDLTAAHVIRGQFHWYGAAGYGIRDLHQLILNSKTVYFINIGLSAIVLVYLRLKKERPLFERHLVALLGFLAMTGVVLLRHTVMKNHSDIHVFFVSRYLFVFAGSVYFYCLWLLLTQPFIPLHPTWQEKVSELRRTLPEGD